MASACQFPVWLISGYGSERCCLKYIYKLEMTVDLPSDSSHSQSPSQRSQEDGAYSIDSAWANDPRNPFNWPLWRKWVTMIISYWVTILVGINATSYTTASEALSTDFNISNSFFEFSFFPVTSWNATAAIVPLATLPMMETFGFRIGYTVCKDSFGVYCGGLIGPRARMPCFSSSSSRNAWHRTSRRWSSAASLQGLSVGQFRTLQMVLQQTSSLQPKSEFCP